MREWAKSLHNRKVRVSNKAFVDGSIIVKDVLERLMIHKTGTLFSKSWEKIAYNRTSQQIKAITENLL